MITCDADKWVSSCCNSTVSAIDDDKYICDECGDVCEKLPWFLDNKNGISHMIDYLTRCFDSDNRKVEE